jgi:hypothetical protein
VAYLGNDLQVAFPTYRNIDDISGSFNGVTTSFPLTVDGVAPIPAPVNSQQCLISVNGVVQRPDDSGAEGFLLSGGNIVFASAPAGGVDFFGVILAGADYINIGANFPSGTALVPSITFDSDLDTGIYNPAGNQIGFTTAGVQRLVINSSGQVSGGLGSATTPAFSFLSDPNTGIYSPGADQVAVATNGVGRLFVDDQGRVGVGAAAVAGVNFNVQGSTPILRVTGASATNPTFQLSAAGITSWSQVVDASNSAFYISKDGTERLRITSAGLVGIGTSTFSYLANKLVIDKGSTANDGITIVSSNTSNACIWFADGTTGSEAYRGGIDYNHSTDKMQIYTGGLGHIAIDSAGNVGINTPNPSSALHVVGAALFNTAQSFIANSATGSVGTFQYNGTSIGDIGSGNQTLSGGSTGDVALTSRAGALVFGINTVEKARLDTSGRLLVGTSTASSTDNDANFPYLQLEGVIGDPSRAMLRCNGGTDQFGGPHLYLSRSRGTSSGSKTSVANDDMLGDILFLGADGADDRRAASIRAFVDGTPGASDMPGRLVFSTTADGANSPIERLRITSAGLVGIGTSSPSSDGPLTLSNSATTPTIFFERESTNYNGAIQCSAYGTITFYNGADSSVVSGLTPRMTIDGQYGRVGINTTSPQSPLDVTGSGNIGALSDLALRVYSANRSAFLDVGFDGLNASTNSSGLKFFLNNTERARIDSSGRLLVGTSTAYTAYAGSNEAKYQQVGTSYQTATIQTAVFANTSAGGGLTLALSRNATAGSHTVVQNGDSLGGIRFMGSDGTNFETGAAIDAFVDGTPGNDDMPTRLTFSTTASGASSPTERTRITSGGRLLQFSSGGDAFVGVTGSGAGLVNTLLALNHSGTSTTTGTNCFYVATNGDVRNTNNSYGAISDIKLKENIVDANSQWDDIKSLQVRKYNFKPKTNQQTHTQIGLVAQEVELVSPGLVSRIP